MKYLLSLIISLVLLTQTAKTAVYVYVVDASNRPVPGAMVQYTDDYSQTTQTVWTNENGYAYLNVIVGLSYDFEVDGPLGLHGTLDDVYVWGRDGVIPVMVD